MKKHAKKIVTALLVVAMLIPTVAMIFTSAADNSFPVELAYNNLFVFDDWANNTLSTTMQVITSTGVSTKGATLETDIENGSFVFTKTDMAATEVFTAYSANTEDPDGNKNYYIIDVEPSTNYTFSYNLSGTVSSFTPYVFFYNTEGLYDSLHGSPAACNGYNSFSFTTPADVIKMQIRFTIGDNSTNTNAASVSATVNEIIICKSELLAPENIFDFEEWANNGDSCTTADGYNLGHGTFDVNISEGSIAFSADGTPNGLFSNFTLGNKDSTDSEGNTHSYYVMDVKPNTVYGFTYDVLDSNLLGAGVAIAWHSSDGNLISYCNLYANNSNGSNSHYIPAPDGAAYLQIAFGAFHSNGTTGTGTFKNIRVFDSESVFNAKDWANNSNSNKMRQDTTADGNGTLTADPLYGTVKYTATVTNGSHFTNYGDLSTCNGFYTADVEPNTTYTFYYDLSIEGKSTPNYFQPYFAEFNEGNTLAALTPHESLTFGENEYTFTTGSTTSRILVAFSFHDDERKECTWTVSDIALCPHKTYESTTGTEHRGVFTYDHSAADSSFYGTLPEATAPEGYVFGGWYTADGERITPETKIKYESFSVFSRFERKIDKLEIAKDPDKTTYTVGEKLDTTGLILKATINNEDGTTSSFNINSDIYCTPVYLDEVNDEFEITAHYGGQTATFKVKVLASETADIYINDVKTTVEVTNKEYTLDSSVSSFNRYTLTYYSNAYVRGVITFETGSEEFFLEPSDNGSFSSLIDTYLVGSSHSKIESIKFTCLDNELGNFQLKSVSTEMKDVPANPIMSYTSGKYELGVDLRYGGVVSDLYYNNPDDPITARVYTTSFNDQSGNPAVTKNLTKVDYASKLDDLNLSSEGLTATNTEESTKVNLINTLDRGRYLQQSYYGTSERPYVAGRFNSSDWRYNPVQGGNVGEEPSKVIDYEITDSYIYIKARPLEWEKWSDDHADNCQHLDSNGNPIHSKIYGNDVVSDTYVEAWYTFEDGMIKVRNRKVDYSGYPEAYANQEMPALYLIEPLNHFVYNDVTKENAWVNSYDDAFTAGTIKNIEEPEFWGIVESYSEMHYPNGTDTDNNNIVDTFVKPNEHWAAFTASKDKDSFGVGIYSEVSNDFYYGIMPQKYASLYDETTGDVIGNSNNLNYRHTESVNPAPEMPTSYIAPLAKMTFKSYDPTEYTYYLSAGTAEEIYTDFRSIDDKVAQAELAKPKVAIPETVYMTPEADASKIGQFYVNNIMDSANYYSVETVAEPADGMYFGLHIKNAKEFKVNITNLSSTADDIYLGKADGTGNYEDTTFTFDDTDSWYADNTYGLHFATTGLKPGEKANAKWEITVTFDDGTTETYTAYTVLFAPERTVGAVANARHNNNLENEISSWITGANGVNHEQRAPLGEFYADLHDSGYFIEDPLVYGYETTPTIPSADVSRENAHDYIITIDESSIGDGGANQTDDYSDTAYVLETSTQDADSTRALSYLGLLTIDKSRYSNTDQIPNLRIGYDALRVGGHPEDSLNTYNTYYTLGTESSFTPTKNELSATPSGWTIHESYSELVNTHSVPYRTSVVPQYTVSDDMDGKYIHAVAYGHAYTWAVGNKHATAGTSVLIDVTDKSALRDAVLDGYVQAEENYNAETYPIFAEKLQNAAIILGDPSATQAEIDNASKELVESTTTVYYALKYDNLFSAYEFSQKAEHFKMVKAYETWQNDNEAVLDEKAVVKYQNGEITVSSNGTDATNADVYTNFGPLDTFYSMPVTGGADYVLEYDVTTAAGAQAHVFFFDESGNEIAIPSHPTAAGTNSMPSPNSATNDGLSNFAGAYTNGATTTKVIVKMTAPASATKAVLRFGNTNNPVNTSTFWNIRFVEAIHFSEEVNYNPTETIYTEDLYEAYDAYETYDQLVDPERIGFTFLYWSYTFGDESTKVQTTDQALAHTSIFSNWYEHEYTIVYKANGGAGNDVTTDPIKYTATATIKDGSTFTRTGYTLVGWSTAPAGATEDAYGFGNSVTRLTPVDGAKITLYAVWAANDVNVTFDNLIDLKAWNTQTANNGTISDVTDIGFSLTSNEAAGEGTSTSHNFSVTGGKEYKIEVDAQGSPWDVYIFFYNSETTSSTGIGFSDSTNRFSSDGGGDADHIFTAPENATYAVIRLDANGIKATDENGNVIKDANGNNTYTGTNTVTFENIRVYENTGISVSPVNKVVTFDGTFGNLPVPTREGYDFVGWFIGDTEYTSASTVENEETYFLNSKWVINDSALVADTVVVDFAKPIEITPLANDTVYASEKATKKFLGFSSDGTNYGASTINGTYGTFTVNGEKVTYKPTTAVNGAEVLYYHASVTDDNGTTYIKNEIAVVPASNVLYEEDKFAVANASGNAWSATATAGTGNQEAYPDADGIEVYGYDSSYNKVENYSNSSALSVTVDNTNKRSQNIAFTFEGTGFDLNSACGSNTGVMIVSLRDNNALNAEGKVTPKIIKSYIVDTYYSDLGEDSKFRYGETLYQVPIISETALSHSNYTIQIVASWLPSMSGALNTNSVSSQTLSNGLNANTASAVDNEALRDALADIGMEYVLDAEEVNVVWFDEDSVLNGGEGANTVEEGMLETQSTVTALVNVIDSVRVYNPITDGDQYYIDSEQGVKYYNVIDNLTTKDSLLSGKGLFAYIMGLDKQDITVENYSSIGPKDELYLASGTDAVTFTINSLDKTVSRVMISLRAAAGKPTIRIGSGYTTTISSNTDMYYDITDYVGEDGTVVIQNTTPGSLLSIGYVKLSGVVQPTMLSAFNLDTALVMMSAPSTPVELNVPQPEPDVEEPGDTTEPTDPEDTTEPTDPEDTTDPDDSTDTTDPADPDDSVENWFVRLVNWIIAAFKRIVSILNRILGF